MGAQFSDYEFGFRYGERYSMDRTSYKEGNFNIATDTGSLSVDVGGNRIELTDIITGYTEVEIRALTLPKGKIYLAKDTFNLLIFDADNGRWRICNSEIISHAQKADTDSEGNNIYTTYETKLDAESTKDFLQGLISSLRDELDTINRFDIVKLNAGEPLPEVGKKFVIYFVPNISTESADNLYTEYIWVEDHYEQIGLITADLSEYYKKSDTMSSQQITDAINSVDVGVTKIIPGFGMTTDIYYMPEADPDNPDAVITPVPGGDITSTGTISLNLRSAVKSSLTATFMGNTENRQYAVGLDKNGKLSVNIPWINYSTMSVDDIVTGTDTNNKVVRADYLHEAIETMMDNYVGAALTALY